jgi:hypothetical protein
MPTYVEYSLYACQSEPKPGGVNSTTLYEQQLEYNEEDELMDYTLYVHQEGAGAPDLDFVLQSCQDASPCGGCDYSTTISWDVDSLASCQVIVAWTNPNSYCALKKVQLHSTKSQGLSPYHCQTAINEGGDPVGYVYPDDDVRNDECMACGIGGNGELCQIQNPIPGEQFQVYGFFTDPNCGDVDTPISLDTAWFEVDGFTGGTVLSLIDTELGYKLIEVQIMGETYQLKSVDMVEPSIGEWIPIAKMGCDPTVEQGDCGGLFPKYHDECGFDNTNVCEKCGSGGTCADFKPLYWDWTDL